MNKSNLKNLAIATAVLCSASAALGQVTNLTSTTVNTLIPDGDPSGLSSQTTISGTAGVITSVSVSLDITGGFNGDLYAYLAGPNGGFAVLLNRAGLTSSNPTGYSDTGFDVTFIDSDPNIHFYQSGVYPTDPSTGQVTGNWAPDGRNIDPQSSPATFDSTSPTADLNSFTSDSANGAWTLFVADVSPGGQSTLVSWGMSVVTAVPEPQTWVLLAGGVGMLIAFNRRRKY